MRKEKHVELMSSNYSFMKDLKEWHRTNPLGLIHGTKLAALDLVKPQTVQPVDAPADLKLNLGEIVLAHGEPF